MATHIYTLQSHVCALDLQPAPSLCEVPHCGCVLKVPLLADRSFHIFFIHLPVVRIQTGRNQCNTFDP